LRLVVKHIPQKGFKYLEFKLFDVSELDEESLAEEASFSDKRDLAKQLETSEEQIDELLSEQGFKTLEDFTDKGMKNAVDLSYQIKDLEKRKLQGLFGEKIAVFVKGRIKEFLKQSLGNNWELKQGIKLKTCKASKSMWYGDRSPDSGIKITDSTIRHRNMEREEIKKKVRKRHFITSEELFNRFSEHQIPNIDQVYYAIKFTGNEKYRKYHLINTESSSFSNQEKERIKLKEVEDFKVIGLEIKTTENKAENLFSSLQRSIRDKASKSPYLDIYSLKVEYDIQTGKIPENVDIRIERCRK